MQRRQSGLRRAVTSPPMPSASGAECVRVLVSLGWLPTSWTDKECHLENGVFALTVPLEPVLSPAQLTKVVEKACLTPYALVAALENLRTGRTRSA